MFTRDGIQNAPEIRLVYGPVIYKIQIQINYFSFIFLALPFIYYCVYVYEPLLLDVNTKHEKITDV